MKDGGPAFPVIEERCYGEENEFRGVSHVEEGMSLRDYFAGQALTGLCSSKSWDDGEEKVVALWAYDLADAMLAAREENNATEKA
jgi:hypothetical protein